MASLIRCACSPRSASTGRCRTRCPASSLRLSRWAPIAVDCDGLRWIAVDCGGLRWIACSSPRRKVRVDCASLPPDGLHTDVPAAAFLIWNDQSQLSLHVAQHPCVSVNRHGPSCRCDLRHGTCPLPHHPPIPGIPPSPPSHFPPLPTECHREPLMATNDH